MSDKKVNEKFIFLSAEIGFLFSIAQDYKNTAKKLIDNQEDVSDKTLGYPLQMIFATAFELYIKTYVATDCVLENNEKDLDQATLKCLCNCLFKTFNHNLIKIFNYKDIKTVLGITSLSREPNNALVSHIEINTDDKKFPVIFLKNSESSRYASFSSKPDIGYLYIQENGTEDEKLKKILNKEKLLDSNDKFLDMLDELEKHVKSIYQKALKVIPYEI